MLALYLFLGALGVIWIGWEIRLWWLAKNGGKNDRQF